MNREQETVRTSRGMKEYTYLGCPLTRNRSNWCFRLCKPDAEGKGRCGRVAPHGLTSNIQAAIGRHNQMLLAAHCEKLERMYLAAPSTQHMEPGIRIWEGNADIVVPVREAFLDAAGEVHGSLCYQAMSDAAQWAVQSLVKDAAILPVRFEVDLVRGISSGEMVARGRFLGGSQSSYRAEAVLSDPDGLELGRGEGVFVLGDVPLTDAVGYA